MSAAPVCQTEPGTFVTSTSPPPKGVVATTLNVGSSIVSAWAAVSAAEKNATPRAPKPRAVQRAIRRKLLPSIVPVRIAGGAGIGRDKTRRVSNARPQRKEAHSLADSLNDSKTAKRQLLSKRS